MYLIPDGSGLAAWSMGSEVLASSVWSGVGRLGDVTASSVLSGVGRFCDVVAGSVSTGVGRLGDVMAISVLSGVGRFDDVTAGPVVFAMFVGLGVIFIGGSLALSV